jgi:hypothetical protein
MRRGRPIKTTPSPQPVVAEAGPFVKLGPSSSVVKFEFTNSSFEDDDISSRFPTIEELSGGAFTSSTPNRSKSQPPPKTLPMENVDALADDAFALPVQPYRKKDVDALADHAFKPERRPSPAAQIRAALEREKHQTEYVESIQSTQILPEHKEEERTLKPSEVIARGGVYSSHPPLAHSNSAPPNLLTSTTPDARMSELRRKAEESRRIIDESRRILEEQWPDTKEPVPQRPTMVSTGTMTSPPPSPPPKPTELRLPSQMNLPPSMTHTEPRSAGLSSQNFSMQETEVRPPRTKSPLPSPAKISSQKDHILSESPRPLSRGTYHLEASRSPLGKGLPKPRPQSLYVNNDLEFLRTYDVKETAPLEPSHTGLSTASQPASLPSSDNNRVDQEMDLEYLRIKDDESKRHGRQVSDHLHREQSADHYLHRDRRSSSSGPTGQKHSRQTSLGALSKGIMSGKFGDAFRKFESFNQHDAKSDSRLRAEKTLAKLAPEEEAVADEEGEDWRVETHDIPVKMRQHLSDTRRISAERDRKPSSTPFGNSRSKDGPARTVTTNPKARMIQERMNDYLTAQTKEKPPPLTADGYGPYISDARIRRNPVDEEKEARMAKTPSVMPKPSVLRRPSLKGSVDR